MKSKKSKINKILEIFSLNAGPLALNISKAIELFKTEKAEGPASLVALRFEKIFNEHGVETSQIPRLIPQVKLENLDDIPDSLISSLTDDVISKTVDLFKIKRSWIEGFGNKIYQESWYYKSPEYFFEDVANLDFSHRNIFYPVIAFCTTSELNYGRYPKH
jgi:hypothetical protein